MKSKKVSLADILWDAANKWLWDGKSQWEPWATHQFSCNALQSAVQAGAPVRAWAPRRFLQECGCPVYSSNAFPGYREGHKKQGVRYMWLLIAMHVAEDEGIHV